MGVDVPIMYLYHVFIWGMYLSVNGSVYIAMQFYRSSKREIPSMPLRDSDPRNHGYEGAIDGLHRRVRESYRNSSRPYINLDVHRSGNARTSSAGRSLRGLHVTDRQRIGRGERCRDHRRRRGAMPLQASRVRRARRGLRAPEWRISVSLSGDL